MTIFIMRGPFCVKSNLSDRLGGQLPYKGSR